MLQSNMIRDLAALIAPQLFYENALRQTSVRKSVPHLLKVTVAQRGTNWNIDAVNATSLAVQAYIAPVSS